MALSSTKKDTKRHGSRQSVPSTIGVFLLLPLFAISLAACTSLPSPTVTPQSPEKTAAAFTFDIPALLGKDIAEIEKALGKPTFDCMPNSEVPDPIEYPECDKTWELGKQAMLVTYETATGAVIDFFISTDDPSGASADSDHMLEVGNLKRNDPRYSLDFVETIGRDATPGEFTGVIIQPN